jgi:iron complex transport system permease protein
MPDVRRSGPFVTTGQRTRYIILVAVLVLAAAALTLTYMTYGNPVPFGQSGFWAIVNLRKNVLIVVALVACCQAFATVSFQTATNNRIITPSIMGFESIYVVMQTSVIFFFGAHGLNAFTGTSQFLVQSALMIVFAVLLFTWLLSGRLGNIQVMLLVGVVLGGGLQAVSTFMQRLLDPNEFDLLTARTFGNIGNAETGNFPIVIPVVIVVCTVLYLRSRRMNVVALGADTANNLGLNHRRELMLILFLVSVLMAMTTSLVGPMTFLGFLVATIAYQLTDTYDHRLILPVAALVGYVFLLGSFFIMRNFFNAEGSVTVIIELIGGSVFLLYILRKGRL